MRVVVDNSVVVDALKPDAQFDIEAQEILRMASAGEIDGFVSANSLTDIFYVLRKERGVEKSKAMIKNLMRILGTIGIEAEDCTAAIEKPMNDFEDALVSVCAEKVQVDCIVTRDNGFLKTDSPVRTVSPADLLSELE